VKQNKKNFIKSYHG